MMKHQQINRIATLERKLPEDLADLPDIQIIIKIIMLTTVDIIIGKIHIIKRKATLNALCLSGLLKLLKSQSR